MTLTRTTSRSVGVAVAVVLLIAASALLLPALSRDDSHPSNGAANADVPIQSAVSNELAAKLDYMGLEFKQDISAGDVKLPQSTAIERSGAEFSGVAKGLPATVAAVGTFTNPTYGKALDDGTTDPYIVNRAAWVVVYENVPQTSSDQFGGNMRQKEQASVTAFTDLAVFVDASTGEVLGATTLLTPEKQPENTGATK